MEYRIFTEKDKIAISIALQVFLRELDGKSRKSKTLLPVVEKALDSGLSLDELFNKENWIRASAVIQGLSPDDYVRLMAEYEILCRPVKEETGWCDDMNNMSLIARCFHDFYMHINPKGGTWNTENARLNLEKAIKMYSLQALMSEETILKAAGNDADSTELTCFNYILGIIKNKIEVEDSPSEMQNYRKCRKEEIDEMMKDQTPSDEADENLRTETNPQADEDDDYIRLEAFMDMYEDEDVVETETFVSFVQPREMKRTAIQSIIYNYKVDELNELMTLIPDVSTLADFIEKLTDGNIDVNNETPVSREIHQYINGDLLPSFIACINMQGFDMTEEMAITHDPLMENWDFRNESTRKLHKLKRLIYSFGEEDPDLLSCIKDIEVLYNGFMTN